MESETDPKFEIGHVLFIDVVGYSKLSIDEQTSLMRDLNNIVRGTQQFQRSEAERKLICLPTGDGMVLVFRDSAESPAQCAFEASQALRAHGRLPVRMGVHSGPVNELNDVNDRVNLAGAGINIAQRVMDCGDAGHVLFSKHVAEDLKHYARWQPFLHDLGEVQVKHGDWIGIVSLYSDSVGNPRTPNKIERSKAESTKGRNRLVLAAVLVLIASSALFAIYRNRPSSPPVPIPEKSIAVLPFANLSANPENAFFADGVQDEILTDLARVADLKVISRTSVMQFRAGTPRDVPAIAKALGVAHLLEGSVQREGGKVRVNAQLIDARNDAHVWANTYDRNLADIFAVQSEIAESIAHQLQAKLLRSEKAAIEKAPTDDLFAYDLYTQASGLTSDMTDPGNTKEKLPRALALLGEAVARDPHFVAAWCLLSKLHARMYSAGFDHTSERLQQARTAIDTALKYEPESGDVHLALANYYYQSLRDYQHAGDELAIAKAGLPNDPQVFSLAGYMQRRAGDWEHATANLERAATVDPRNVHTLQQLALTYQAQRRYREQAATYDRVLAIVPDDPDVRFYKALIPANERADIRPFQAAKTIGDDINYSLCERTPEAYAWGLEHYPRSGSVNVGVNYPYAYWEGVVSLCLGDNEKAKKAFTAARSEVVAVVERNPELAGAVSLLGLIDAALGRKKEAISEGQRACALLPIAKDAIDGPVIAANLAQIYVWTGEKELAIAQLEAVENVPNYLSYGLLKLQPFWDPLRGNPRFEKLLASLPPKS